MIALLIRSGSIHQKSMDAYRSRLVRAGGAYREIYDTDSNKDVLEKLMGVSGILITGAKEKGNWDMFLVEYALRKGLCLLGTCQGMQDMCEYGCVGNIVEVQDSSHYCVDVPKNYVHTVMLEESSKLKGILGTRRVLVNSMHKLHALDSGVFVPTGFSQDGILESIENPDHRFQIGIQWHPEQLEDEYSYRLYDSFVKACS